MRSLPAVLGGPISSGAPLGVVWSGAPAAGAGSSVGGADGVAPDASMAAVAFASVALGAAWWAAGSGGDGRASASAACVSGIGCDGVAGRV